MITTEPYFYIGVVVVYKLRRHTSENRNTFLFVSFTITATLLRMPAILYGYKLRRCDIADRRVIAARSYDREIV